MIAPSAADRSVAEGRNLKGIGLASDPDFEGEPCHSARLIRAGQGTRGRPGEIKSIGVVENDLSGFAPTNNIKPGSSEDRVVGADGNVVGPFGQVLGNQSTMENSCANIIVFIKEVTRSIIETQFRVRHS